MTSYDVFHKAAIHWLIPTYFFLGGASAGLFVLSVAFNNWLKKYQVLARPAAVLSPLFLAAGMGLLVLDLGQPFRFIRLMLTFQPSSVASWGTWLLSIFFALNVLHAFLVNKGETARAKKIGYLGLPFAFAAAAYTGALLAQMQGKALWHTALLPWLFVVGALISGLALVILAAIALGKTEELGESFFALGKTLGLLVMLELALVLTEVFVLLNGGSDALVGVQALLTGAYSFSFWGVEIILGAIVPIFILLIKKARGLSLQSVAAMLVLIGIYAMRLIVVMAGQI